MQTINIRKPFQILLVEDNLGDIRLLQEILNETQIPNHLHVVNDGERAVDFLLKAEAMVPDLILLDWNLPGKNGLEVLTQIKTHLKLKNIPVIVLSSSGSEDDIVKAYGAQANCYITKPAGLDDYIKMIKSVEDFWMKTVKLP